MGLALGLLLAVAVAWWARGPSEATVRRTVVTTVQEETPASFLVTGTLDLRVEVAVDSSQYLTPDWLTTMLRVAQPSALPLLRGRSRTEVRVPGRVSYGFHVQALSPDMIHLSDDDVVRVELPPLSVHSVDPDLPRLEVWGRTEGWMRVFPSDANEAVRTEALSAVEAAFREQAQRHLGTATQPRVNTARALEAMLRPALQAAGLASPRFRIRVGDRLVLQPEE
jgi:hypothetical protein